EIDHRVNDRAYCSKASHSDSPYKDAIWRMALYYCKYHEYCFVPSCFPMVIYRLIRQAIPKDFQDDLYVIPPLTSISLIALVDVLYQISLVPLGFTPSEMSSLLYNVWDSLHDTIVVLCLGLMTPDLICPSTYQPLRSSSGDFELDMSLDMSASLKYLSGLARLTLAESTWWFRASLAYLKLSLWSLESDQYAISDDVGHIILGIS
nr:hypothetical protein [Tanacetum cinerariifolium]